MTFEAKIRLAAQLYEARDAARLFLGDKYAERMKEGADLLKQAQQESGKNVLAIAAFMARVAESNEQPFAAAVILAAAVEMLEPSIHPHRERKRMSQNEDKPLRPRQLIDTPYVAVEPKRVGFEKSFNLLHHSKHAPDPRMDFARQLITHFGVIAGAPDGEDAAGRQKGKLLEPDEVVNRAIAITEKAFAAFEERGWLIELPSVDALYDMARENADRN